MKKSLISALLIAFGILAVSGIAGASASQSTHSANEHSGPGYQKVDLAKTQWTLPTEVQQKAWITTIERRGNH